MATDEKLTQDKPGFTPGKWEVRSSVPYSDGLTIFRGHFESNRTIGYVYWCADKAELEANANLIAASPQLYEALEAVVAIGRAIRIADPYPTLPGFNGRTFSEHIHMAEAALKSARGEK